MAMARLGASLMPQAYSIPLTRWTIRSPAMPGAVLLEASPAGEHDGVEGPLGHVPLPGVPVQGRGREVGGRRIDPGSRGVVAAERALHQGDVAQDALGDQLPGLGAEHRAHALRPDLHDAPALLRRRHHLEAVGGGVGHRLLAVDVLARAHRVHHDLPVPVVGHGGHDAVDVLVVEQLVVAARGEQLRARDLPGQGVAAVVEIAGGRALYPRERDGGLEEARPLHADTDHPEAHPIARGAGSRRSLDRLGIEQHLLGGEDGGGSGARLQERTAGRAELHEWLLAGSARSGGSGIYFSSGRTATSLKNTTSCLPWFWRPM